MMTQETLCCCGVSAHWWSWSWRRWRSRCPETGCPSSGRPSVRPLPPRLRCLFGRPSPPRSHWGCWRWSWRSGCGREGSLQRVEKKRRPCQQCLRLNDASLTVSGHICPLFCPILSIRLCVCSLTSHHPFHLKQPSFQPPSLPPIIAPSISLSQLLPILTGKPGGKRRVMKSRSLANRAFEIAMRSMIGTTCSARDRGWDSHNHNLALNLETQTHTHTQSVNTHFIWTVT